MERYLEHKDAVKNGTKLEKSLSIRIQLMTPGEEDTGQSSRFENVLSFH